MESSRQFKMRIEKISRNKKDRANKQIRKNGKKWRRNSAAKQNK